MACFAAFILHINLNLTNFLLFTSHGRTHNHIILWLLLELEGAPAQRGGGWVAAACLASSPLIRCLLLTELARFPLAASTATDAVAGSCRDHINGLGLPCCNARLS